MFPAVIALTMVAMSMTGCGGSDMPIPPTSPTPPPPPPSPTQVTASAYILPGAIALNDWAFGDEPIVIYAGERLRWVNTDTVAHVVVADSPDATDFRTTDELALGGERAFTMTRLGTTGIHCAIHPNMTGILTVRAR
jgi:plastocyanin